MFCAFPGCHIPGSFNVQFMQIQQRVLRWYEVCPLLYNVAPCLISMISPNLCSRVPNIAVFLPQEPLLNVLLDVFLSVYTQILSLYYLIFNTNYINVMIDIFNIYCCIVVIFVHTLYV